MIKFSLQRLFTFITILGIGLASFRDHLLSGAIYKFLKDFFHTFITNICIFSGSPIPHTDGILSSGQALGELGAFCVNFFICAIIFLLLIFVIIDKDVFNDN